MTSKRDAYRGILAAADRMVNRGDEADAVLRSVVELLHERLAQASWVGISLLEDGRLELGPQRGGRSSGATIEVPIEYERRQVGTLALESSDPAAFDDEDRRALERLATVLSEHALVAWDTRGEAWEP